MNALERAVIEAARAVSGAWKATIEYVHADTAARSQRAIDALSTAVAALDTYEREQAGKQEQEIGWHLVTCDDLLRGKSGDFYPVLRTKREWSMGKYTGKHVITVKLPSGPRDIVRPNAAEPFATVRRGQDGRAVDEFVSVFESGEM